MLAEYSFYHGAALRELILNSKGPVTITPHDQFGRPNIYLLDGRVGILIKHSAKRITPWTFTFTREHLSELAELSEVANRAYVCFVCGEDGVCCVDISSLADLLKPSNKAKWVRFDRRAKEMYRVSTSEGDLPNKLARGVDEVIASLRTTGGSGKLLKIGKLSK